MVKIDYKNDACKFTGVWQENSKNEIVSYGTIAFFEIGFTGEFLQIDGNIKGECAFFVDGEEILPERNEKGFTFNVNYGKHIFKIKVYKDSHFSFKSISADENFFGTTQKTYIHFIGDSITHAYPGFASSSAETIGIDYSVVAHCGMSLVDGWGWYPPPEWMKIRMGMETRYFQLESPTETDNYTKYDFSYSRTPDIIVIFLGTNDYLDTVEDKENGNIGIFTEHFLSFVSKIRVCYPKSKILIMKALSDKYCRNEGIQMAFDVISDKICDIELIQSDTWGVEISNDGTHPTELGYEQIAENLVKYLKDINNLTLN